MGCPLQDRPTDAFIPGTATNASRQAWGRIVRMDLALEFHDSEVHHVAAGPSVLQVRFSAAAVRAPDGRHGWLSGVVLSLAEPRLAGDTALAIGRLVGATVRQDGRLVAAFPLPAAWTGALELTLQFANGTLLSAQGSTLTLAAGIDAAFTEDLSC
jgi:hypothetical protein